MAQDDLTVANASGAAVRADVNANLQALGTLMSGATAPSTTWPFMWWADTANDLLKQRNAANSAWINKGTLSAAYGALPASSVVYSSGSPTLIAASDVQSALDALAVSISGISSGVFTKQFSSSNQTITTSGSLTLAHSMAAVPKLVQGFLKCTTAELNYSVGDELPIGNGFAVYSAGHGVSFTYDNTNIYVRFSANLPNIPNKTSGTDSGISASNWRLIVRAWA